MGDENKKDTKNTIENLKITKKKKKSCVYKLQKPPLKSQNTRKFPK